MRYAWEKYEKNQKKKEMANLKSKSVEDNLVQGMTGMPRFQQSVKGSDSDEEWENIIRMFQ